MNARKAMWVGVCVLIVVSWTAYNYYVSGN
jgi:hypothetical protein